LSAAAVAALAGYDFPGNMRELKNAIEHAVIMADGDTIEAEHLPRSFHTSAPPPAKPEPAEPSLAELRDRWLAPHETRYLAELLSSSNGSVRRAAKRAGVDAVTMYKLLRKRGLAFGRDRLNPRT
jgi:DNA-binding NtrC family response regulator